MKFTIASLFVVITIVAVCLGAFMHHEALKRQQMENVRLAKEFLNNHGSWEYAKAGDDWDLSGISDLKVDEFALLQHLSRYDRGRIRSIDLSDSNVTDEHVRFLRTLPMIEEIDLDNTVVSSKGIEKILDAQRYRQPDIYHPTQEKPVD